MQEQRGGRLRFWLAVLALVAGMAAGVLAWIGAGEYLGDLGDPKLADRAYLTAQTFTLSLSVPAEKAAYPWELQVAGFLAPASVAVGALLALIALLREAWDRVRIQAWRLRHWTLRRNVVVVAGLGSVGLQAVKSLESERRSAPRGERRRVVAIEAGNSEAAAIARSMGAAVVTGDARERDTWRRARVRRASEVLVACGQDQISTEAAMAARDEIEPKPRSRGRLRDWLQRRQQAWARVPDCVRLRVHLDDRDLVARHRVETLRRGRQGSRIDDRAVNNNDLAAAQLLAIHPPFSLVPTDLPRIVIIGTSPLARALLICLARSWAIARQCTFPGQKLPVVLAASDADPVWQQVAKEVATIEEVLQVEVHQDHLAAADLRKELGVDGRHEQVYICLEDETAGAAVALRLVGDGREEPYPKRPVVVQSRVTRGTTRYAVTFESDPSRGRVGELAIARVGKASIATFAPLEVACDRLTLFGDEKEQQARVAHDMYRAQRFEAPEPERGENDPMLGPWWGLDSDTREANKEQLAVMVEHWQCVGVGEPEAIPEGDGADADAAEDPRARWPVGVRVPLRWGELDRLARREHDRWCRGKREKDVVFGPRDPKAKPPTHPDLLPYDLLSEDTKQKDRVAILGYVQGLADAGLELPERRVRGVYGLPGWEAVAAGDWADASDVDHLDEGQVELLAEILYWRFLAHVPEGEAPDVEWPGVDGDTKAACRDLAREALPLVAVMGLRAQASTVRPAPLELTDEMVEAALGAGILATGGPDAAAADREDGQEEAAPGLERRTFVRAVPALLAELGVQLVPAGVATPAPQRAGAPDS